MAQASGSPFKLVYSNWYTIDNVRYPLANGLHPALVKWMQDKITNDHLQHSDDFFRIKEIDDCYYYNNPKSGYYFRNSNFFYHFKESFGLDNIVSEDQVTDGSYYYPIELECNTVQFVLNETDIMVNGVEYRHSIKNSLTPKILELLQTGRVKLLLVNMIDPSIEPSILEEVEELLLKLGIKGSNIVCLQGNVRYDIKTSMTLLGSDIALYQTANLMDKYPFDTGLNYVSDYVKPGDLSRYAIRSKRFLSFNRMGRPHRIGLCQLAIEHKLLREGFFSFLFDVKHDTVDMLNRVMEGTDEMVEDIASIVPYHLDTDHLPDEQRFTFFPVYSNKKEFYRYSYVHITTETDFDKDETPFFSEKTWRPILNLQPFIYMGNYAALNKLHQLGFKTFHPFIDESYDLEKDHKKRFALIKQEILKIAQLPIGQLNDWYHSITDVLIHNQNHLHTFKNYNPFQELLNYESKQI